MFWISLTSLPAFISNFGVVRCSARLSPKCTIVGVRTRYASTPPATMMEAMRGPMM